VLFQVRKGDDRKTYHPNNDLKWQDTITSKLGEELDVGASEEITNGEEMKILGESTVDERTTQCSRAQDQNFEWVGVLGRLEYEEKKKEVSMTSPDREDQIGRDQKTYESERCWKFMMNFVNHLVQRRCVQSPMSKVMNCILNREEQRELKGHLLPRREGELVGLKAKEGGERMKAADEGELDEEV
jgi:hypothetical protein